MVFQEKKIYFDFINTVKKSLLKRKHVSFLHYNKYGINIEENKTVIEHKLLNSEMEAFIHKRKIIEKYNTKEYRIRKALNFWDFKLKNGKIITLT